MNGSMNDFSHKIWKLAFCVLLGLNLSLFFIYWFFCRVDTEYASGYSEKEFDKLNCSTGMTEVVSLLGYPLESAAFDINGQILDSPSADNYRIRDGAVRYLWQYSRQGRSDANYMVRFVEFDKDGRIFKVIKETYYD